MKNIPFQPGEVGGYMGLLIGASALTICEVLDLIIYNIILKMVDARHKFRSVTDVDAEKEKKKPPNSNDEATKQDFAKMEAQQYRSLVMKEMPPIEDMLKDPEKIQYKDSLYNPYSANVNLRE